MARAYIFHPGRWVNMAFGLALLLALVAMQCWQPCFATASAMATDVMGEAQFSQALDDGNRTADGSPLVDGSPPASPLPAAPAHTAGVIFPPPSPESGGEGGGGPGTAFMPPSSAVPLSATVDPSTHSPPHFTSSAVAGVAAGVVFSVLLAGVVAVLLRRRKSSSTSSSTDAGDDVRADALGTAELQPPPQHLSAGIFVIDGNGIARPIAAAAAASAASAPGYPCIHGGSCALGKPHGEGEAGEEGKEADPCGVVPPVAFGKKRPSAGLSGSSLDSASSSNAASDDLHSANSELDSHRMAQVRGIAAARAARRMPNSDDCAITEALVTREAAANSRIFSVPLRCCHLHKMEKQVVVSCFHSGSGQPARPKRATDLRTLFDEGFGHVWLCAQHCDASGGGGGGDSSHGSGATPQSLVAAALAPQRRLEMRLDDNPFCTVTIPNTVVATFDAIARLLLQVDRHVLQQCETNGGTEVAGPSVLGEKGAPFPVVTVGKGQQRGLLRRVAVEIEMHLVGAS